MIRFAICMLILTAVVCGEKFVEWIMERSSPTISPVWTGNVFYMNPESSYVIAGGATVMVRCESNSPLATSVTIRADHVVLLECPK